MLHLPSRIGNFGQLAIRTSSMDDGGRSQQEVGGDRFLLQGYLLKRSETLRRWNKRWFSLDPTTARLEYRSQRSDLYARGQIVFDANSTITVSPINFNSGAKQYDGCCLYIGTPRKKEYFLAAETPAAARAWVTALRAAMQVLKAHRDAVNALGNADRRQQSEAALRAAATASNVTAQAMAKEISAASQKLVLQGFGLQADESAQADDASDDGVMDGTTIMKETLRVKDEELAQMAHDLRARDATIREMADRLSETAEAAEAAAAAAMQMDRDRKAAVSEAAQARRLAENALKEAEGQIKGAEERVAQKVKRLEADREEAIHRAMQWKAEADRAHEKARALELALRQAQGAAPIADEPPAPSKETAVAPPSAPQATTTNANKPTEVAQAPPDVSTAGDSKASGLGIKGSAQQAAPVSQGQEAGLQSSSNEESPAGQQPERKEVTVDSSARGNDAAPHEPKAASKPDEGVETSVKEDTELPGRSSHPETPTKHEGAESPTVHEATPVGVHQSVAEKKQSGEERQDSGSVDDVPAMDSGFLAAFRQGSLGGQQENGKPDDL